MTNTITLNKPEGDQGQYFCHYPQQIEPHSQYLELDLESGEVSAGYDAEIGGGIPMRVWHGTCRRYTFPFSGWLNADLIHGAMDTLAPLLQRVYNGGSVELDDRSNFVGVLTEDAAYAEMEIDEELHNLEGAITLTEDLE